LLNLSNKEYEKVEENTISNTKISINYNNLKRIIKIRNIMTDRDKDKVEIRKSNKENLDDQMKMAKTLLQSGNPRFIKKKMNKYTHSVYRQCDGKLFAIYNN